MTMPPRPGVAAYVRDLAYEHEGREVRGTLHFAPGTLVYVHPPHSGDGWERTYITGPHRKDGRFSSVLGPRSRLVHHHRRVVTDPDALLALARRGGYWEAPHHAEDLAAFSEDELGDTRRAGWPDGEWERLTSRLLSPARPRVTECLAAVLDVTPDVAADLVDRGLAGRALRAVAKGEGGFGPTPLRRARDAWEALAPVEWAHDPGRRFLGPDGVERDAPDSPLAAACLCSDVEGVMAAEAIARELAAACGVGGAVEVAWRPVTRSEAHQRVPRVPWGRPPAETLGALSEALASGLGALVFGETGWRPTAVAAAAGYGAATRDPLPPVLALIERGYALERVEPGRVTLLCPLLPTA